MELVIFIFGIVLSITTGVIGASRGIGWGVSVISLFLSPFVGLLIVFNSRKTSSLEFESRSIENQKRMIALLEKQYGQPGVNTDNEIKN